MRRPRRRYVVIICVTAVTLIGCGAVGIDAPAALSRQGELPDTKMPTLVLEEETLDTKELGGYRMQLVRKAVTSEFVKIFVRIEPALSQEVLSQEKGWLRRDVDESGGAGLSYKLAGEGTLCHASMTPNRRRESVFLDELSVFEEGGVSVIPLCDHSKGAELRGPGEHLHASLDEMPERWDDKRLPRSPYPGRTIWERVSYTKATSYHLSMRLPDGQKVWFRYPEGDGSLWQGRTWESTRRDRK